MFIIYRCCEYDVKNLPVLRIIWYVFTGAVNIMLTIYRCCEYDVDLLELIVIIKLRVAGQFSTFQSKPFKLLGPISTTLTAQGFYWGHCKIERKTNVILHIINMLPINRKMCLTQNLPINFFFIKKKIHCDYV